MEATTEKEGTNTVFISNIAPSATEKTVADFFAFCGTITSLTMLKQANSNEGVQEAILEFKQDAAVKTALLLTNAFIVDRPIAVSRYTSEQAKKAQDSAHSSVTFKQDEIANKPHQAPASQRTQTSVIASLLAAGYTLATGTLESAKKYDEQHHISATLAGTAEVVKQKATELDKDYKISQTASSWTSSAVSAISDLDKRYAVSSSASSWVQSASDWTSSAVKPIRENPTVAQTVDSIKTSSEVLVSYAGTLKDEATKYIAESDSIRLAGGAISHAGSVVKEEYDSVIQETNRLIEEKKKEQGDTQEDNKEEQKEEKDEKKDDQKKEEKTEK